jgi:hypothetical protein
MEVDQLSLSKLGTRIQLSRLDSRFELRLMERSTSGKKRKDSVIVSIGVVAHVVVSHAAQLHPIQSLDVRFQLVVPPAAPT